ncbi:MAG: DUF2520 domain-containing protein [Chloroflexi bacterium]|nr:DUF2520 domain-containing protein [Chloroflexota bacterium]
MRDLKEAAIGFIGAGTVGSTLAMALARTAYQVKAIASRTFASAERLAAQVPGCHAYRSPQEVAEVCDLVFITTPDDAIRTVATAVRWRRGQAVVHCSGAETLEPLAPARAAGSLVGSIHPLQTFSSPEQGMSALPGTAFAIEAEPPLREALEGLASALGGWPIHIRAEDRVLYHISAITACGFLATVVKLAADLWDTFEERERGSRGQEMALTALLPLVRGTLEGLGRQGLPGALTGPFVRGDVGTIRKHLAALEARAPSFLHLYCHLGLAELPIARAKGRLDQRAAAEIQELLEQSLVSQGEPVGEPQHRG